MFSVACDKSRVYYLCISASVALERKRHSATYGVLCRFPSKPTSSINEPWINTALVREGRGWREGVGEVWERAEERMQSWEPQRRGFVTILSRTTDLKCRILRFSHDRLPRDLCRILQHFTPDWTNTVLSGSRKTSLIGRVFIRFGPNWQENKEEILSYLENR